jgi:diphthamide synthase subunit DPH2
MVTQIKKIVLCSSAAFYEHVNQVADELEALGFEVVVPHTARKMRESGNYDVASVKTWYDNSDDFSKKTALMTGHFKEVEEGDVVLVVNDEKKGIKGYVGPNVLLEMGLAFYLNKPIYVLNDCDRTMPTYEEVVGLGSIVIDGDLGKII